MNQGRVLVTGGAGYLGSHVVDLLGERAIVYDRLLYSDEYLNPVKFIRADVNDHAVLRHWLREVDSVIWLAAIVGDAACLLKSELAIATNDRAVQFLAENFDGRIIYTSSCSAYGASASVADESSPLDPLSVYAETKISGEQHLRDRSSSILRLGTLHGVSARMRFDLVVNALTLRALTTKRIQVHGGSQWRPMLGVRDAAKFIVGLLDGEWRPGIYNVATENLRVLNLAERVRAQVPDIEMEILGEGYEDKRDYQVSTKKAERMLGLLPQDGSVDRSIREVSELIASGRLRDLASARYVNVAALQQFDV